MYLGAKIGVIIPCYRVKAHVIEVIANLPPEVDLIVCVDDACPDGSGRAIEEYTDDPRVRVVYHTQNRGVGGAVKTGYLAAREAGCDIAVKVDGDGQMNPRLVLSFVHPIAAGLCDYSKGNRFYRLEDVRAMPSARLVGNAVLSFLTKASTGYWSIFDPTNGYTAIHLAVLDIVPLGKVADRYFFESDLLFRLHVARCVVRDVPMQAVYGNERSNLKAVNMILPFLAGHVRNFFKRIFYEYFLRDFHVASLEMLLGPLMLIGGAVFGGFHWWLSAITAQPATAGTVMIPALMMIIGFQLCLAALSFDMANVPTDAVHPLLVHHPPAGKEVPTPLEQATT